MRLKIEAHLDYLLPAPADVLLQIEVAATPEQRLEEQALTIWADAPIRAIAGEDGVGQRCWIGAVDRMEARYDAIVEVRRPAVALAGLAATPPRGVPAEVTRYLLPSRYCPVDRLWRFVQRDFAGLAGGALAAALADWVAREIVYDNATPADGTAADSFALRSGVCRDFAHLLVTLARAGNIPARCAAAYAPGVDPPDFHAVAELWLDGGWHLVDATGMARADELAVVAVGRDAADIAFMTIFGRATLARQSVAVTRLA